MKQELISVIVPIYNVEDYLVKCIDSIINQTYKNLDIILVDDGSTDKSGVICDAYKLIDNRIKVIHKSNEGLSSARNSGLDIANGDLISFVDSDDYIEFNMLEELKNNMDKYNSDISVCDFYRIINNKKKEHNFIDNEFVVSSKDKFIHLENKYGILTVYAWNKLYKKYLFKYVKYPYGKICEDSYIICDLLDRANKISYITKPLYNYIYRNGSIAHSFSINHFDLISSCDRQINFYQDKMMNDLELKALNKKQLAIILNLAKMKVYGINDKDTYNYYYDELINTNNSINWSNSNKSTKRFKVLGKNYIRLKSLEYYIYYKMNGKL